MSTEKLTPGKKTIPSISKPSGKSNQELYRELAKQKRKNGAIAKLIQEEEFPWAVLEVYFQRFLS